MFRSEINQAFTKFIKGFTLKISSSVNPGSNKTDPEVIQSYPELKYDYICFEIGP